MPDVIFLDFELFLTSLKKMYTSNRFKLSAVYQFRDKLLEYYS